MEAANQRVGAPKTTLAYVLQEYQKSDAFTNLAPASRKNFVRIVGVIETEFGDLPIAALKAKGMRKKFKDWRAKVAERSLSHADMHWMVLAPILSWAVEENLVDVNPCTRGGKLYSGTRRDKIWSDDQITFFLSNAAERFRLPFLIALWTGQPEADIVDLSWAAYDSRYIRLEQKKGRRSGQPGPRVIIPVAAALKAALDATPRVATKMVLDATGTPWASAASFSEVFRKEKNRLARRRRIRILR
jgi:integrase